jgi:Nuclease A inhibitor-like protein
MAEKNEIIFTNNGKKTDELFTAIKSACEGLIYISETDSPVEAFAAEVASEISGKSILSGAGLPPETPIAESSFDDLFARLTAERDWYGDVEKARAKKFLELKGLLEENLSGLKVFRAGHIQITIFAVGADAGGNILGVTTRAVET